MNAENVTSAQAAAHSGSPGGMIRAARTRAGLSIEELCSRTRLARPTIEAMENDAFDQLLEPVYVRGYYRKCARILEIPEQPLIAAYDAMYTPPPKVAPARLRLASGGDLGSAPRLTGRFAVIAAIAAIVLVPLIYLMRQTSVSPDSAQTPILIEPGIDAASPVISDTMPPIDPPVTASSPDAIAAPALDGTTVDGTAAAPVDGSLPAAATDVPAAPPAPVGTQLVLEFEAISWARVEDSSGKSMLSGVISAGEKHTLDGKPPYSVFLGNAPGVKVQFGGTSIDVKPHMKSNSTARFSVPAAGR